MKYKFDSNGDIRVKINQENYINLRDVVAVSGDVTSYELNGIMRLVDPNLFLWQQKKTVNEKQRHPKPFSLRPEDIQLPKECPITQECWDRDCLPERWGTPFAPNIDRLDNKLGYERYNIVIMRHDWNTFKGFFDLTAIERMIENRKMFEGVVLQQYQQFETTLKRLGLYSPKEFLLSLANNDYDEEFGDWWYIVQERLINLRDLFYQLKEEKEYYDY